MHIYLHNFAFTSASNMENVKAKNRRRIAERASSDEGCVQVGSSTSVAKYLYVRPVSRLLVLRIFEEGQSAKEGLCGKVISFKTMADGSLSVTAKNKQLKVLQGCTDFDCVAVVVEPHKLITSKGVILSMYLRRNVSKRRHLRIKDVSR